MTYSYDVNLKSLKVGINGDYTVSSSERLYGNYFMQEKLLYAYEEKAKGTKTLIFNNGIHTSLMVAQLFEEEGYEIRHLDNTHTEKERQEILTWFHEKPDAILTSVSILTTGFDEPSVETIILNRATKSLTLYHQMIGRGSRVFGKKKEFTVIDLGNNARRFGLWDAHVNWQDIFRAPNAYLEGLYTDEEIEETFVYDMPERLKVLFRMEELEPFSMKEAYIEVTRKGKRPKEAIEVSLQNHVIMIKRVAEDEFHAIELIDELDGDIEQRIRDYTKCISKTTDNYRQWLIEEYNRKLKQGLRLAFED